MVSSESAITSSSVRTFDFTPTHKGDHAYRNGVLKWAVPQGMWGILRVQPSAVIINKAPGESHLVMGISEAEADTVPRKNFVRDSNHKYRDAKIEHVETIG